MIKAMLRRRPSALSGSLRPAPHPAQAGTLSAPPGKSGFCARASSITPIVSGSVAGFHLEFALTNRPRGHWKQSLLLRFGDPA